LNYMAEKERQAFDFISGHPGWFARQTVRRIVYLWTGYWSLDSRYLEQEPLDPPNIFFCSALTALALLGMWRALRKDFSAALPYALVLIVFPLVYYVTHPEVYYRRQIDPMFLVLGVFAVVSPRQFPAKPEELCPKKRKSRTRGVVPRKNLPSFLRRSNNWVSDWTPREFRTSGSCRSGPGNGKILAAAYCRLFESHLEGERSIEDFSGELILFGFRHSQTLRPFCRVIRASCR